MTKYLLLLILINGVLGSWSSDLSEDPWDFGKTMQASDYLVRPDDQENIEPHAASQAIKSTNYLSRPFTKSKTSLNLLADAQLASFSCSTSSVDLAKKSSMKAFILVPQHDKYTKYYHNLDFLYLGAEGEMLKLTISRDLPCTRTGQVFPATCRLTFKDCQFSEQTPTVFTQQSFEGPHDTYEVPINGALYNKFVLKIPTKVENLVSKTKDKLPAQIIFYKTDGQVNALPLELKSLAYDKPESCRAH
jgi:hypothetical protein